MGSADADLRYICEDDHTGYGDAADRLVRAVRATGTAVEYRGWSNWMAGETPATKPCSRDDDPNRTARPDALTVAHLVPEHYPHVRDVVPPGPLVGHTVWETDAVPDHWPALLNDIDRVIVPTNWNRQVFREGGVTTPISVVPHAIEPAAGPPAALDLDLPDDLVVFTCVGRWDERKAPALTIEAYLRAFTADDPVLLVVKTGTRAERPTTPGWADDGPLSATPALEIARLMRGHANPPRLHLTVGDWAPARIAALHQRADCFVSLTHGEGWGLGLFDAVTHGCATVTTGWGAPVEWMGPDASGLVDYDLVPVEHAFVGSYSPNQRWAEPDLDHAETLIRQVADDPAAARRQAAAVTAHVTETYAPATVARTFIDALDL